MKWIGAIIFICMTTFLGFDFSKRLNERTKQIRTLIQSLQLFEAEMSYSSFTLREIFLNISKKIDGPLSDFYKKLSERLNDYVDDFITIWDEELIECMKNTSLKDNEKEILQQFGRNIGQHTFIQQQKHIKLTIHYLQLQLEEAETQRQRYGTMTKSLGVLIGLFIVILLF